MSFADKYGPWALITGASQGLGAEFARQVAARGLHVVLVARSAPALRERADEIEAVAGVRTRVVSLDLADEGAPAALAAATDDLEIGLLVNNAGISTVGPFLDRDPDFLARQVYVNVRAGVVLARLFAPRMVERGRGGLVFLSSGSALHGTPWSAAYCGTKAYNVMLAEALWYELRPRGVDVLGFLAGATRTPGFQANGPGRSRLVPVMDVQPAVAQALRALGRRPSVAAGRLNRLGYGAMGLMPRAAAVRVLGRSMSTLFGPFPQAGGAVDMSQGKE
ncbi:MAG: SDR family NAD(P)-dependent oxidoreductase [Micrococcales bacterium]|nr:SDR family NAD(P)-dependent oxidoreductase [Micrococcales bacterium]